jgi:CheY-like chemotaxis protein
MSRALSWNVPERAAPWRARPRGPTSPSRWSAGCPGRSRLRWLVPKGRVLIVDDDDEVRAATQDAMERRGYEVVAVSSGAEALSFIAQDVPSIMLLDLHMDDMNGWEVLTELRANPRYQAVRVVVVTGSDASVPPNVRVLRKPFTIAGLVALLEDDPSAAAS